jgi:hypothetical protein
VGSTAPERTILEKRKAPLAEARPLDGERFVFEEA